MNSSPKATAPIGENGMFVKIWDIWFDRIKLSIFNITKDGLNETVTFGGGSSGEIKTITFTNGVATGRTLVP